MRKYIGKATIDSGKLLLVDPCYLADWNADQCAGEERPADFSYSGACANRDGPLQGPGYQVAINVGTGGDGTVPVYLDESDGVTRVVIILPERMGLT